MSRKSYWVALASVGLLALTCAAASAQPYSQHRYGDQVDVGIFYDGLAPYGDWVEMPDYGWSWAPRVERGWRPYTRGQWVMTEDGWFWDSDEQFGWAAYHYGRWVDDPYYGWVWVPGTEWAPAWVSWRHGHGYTGWAPLPPRATWQSRVGLSIGGLEIDAFIGARDYTFVQDRSFVDRGVYQRLLPPTENVTIINVTSNVTNYTVVNERVVNGGIPFANVERAVGRPVPRVRTVDVDRFDAPRRARKDEIAAYRPLVRVAPDRRPAQGRSLVKGEAPPPLLAQRRQERDQERQQKGHPQEVTAKEVQQQRGVAGAPQARTPEAPRPPQAGAPDALRPPQARAPEASRPPQAGAPDALRPPPSTHPDSNPQPGAKARDQAPPNADKPRAKGHEPPAPSGAPPPTARPAPPEARPPQKDARQHDHQAPPNGDKPQAKGQDQPAHPKEAPPQAKNKGEDKGGDKGKKGPKATPPPPAGEPR